MLPRLPARCAGTFGTAGSRGGAAVAGAGASAGAGSRGGDSVRTSTTADAAHGTRVLLLPLPTTEQELVALADSASLVPSSAEITAVNYVVDEVRRVFHDATQAVATATKKKKSKQAKNAPVVASAVVRGVAMRLVSQRQPRSPNRAPQLKNQSAQPHCFEHKA